MDCTEMTSMYLSGSTEHYVDDSGRYVTYWKFGYSDAKVAAHVRKFDFTLDVENHRREVAFVASEIVYDGDGNLVLDENGKHTTKPMKYRVKSFVIELEPTPDE
jgi:hypothetical protein